MPCGQASPRRVELIPRPPCGLLRSRSHCVARLRARSPHPSAPRGSPKSKANPQLRKKPFAFARARGPECASRTKTKTTGRAVFFIDPQTRTASSEIDFDYDELVSGAIIYGYANQNPMTFTDPNGLTSLVFNVETGVLTVDPEVLGRRPYDINVTSGKGKCENKPKCEQMPDKGPIPRGNYEIYPSRIDNPSLMNDLRRNFRDGRSQGGGDWGDWRVRIYPLPGTKRFGRTGFYLHGGWWDGSAGCIDIGGGIFGNDKLLKDLQRDPNDKIPLLVR